MEALSQMHSPGSLLGGERPARFEAEGHLWGFAGLHGGLALGLLAAAMHDLVPETDLQTVTGQFHRGIRGDFGIEAATVRRGSTVTTATAAATSNGETHISASAVFAPAGSGAWTPTAPSRPDAPPPEQCPVFTIPREFAPISEQTEIRPVGPNRPYAGGDEPELTAWIRLLEDDAPPDPFRFVFLADALAPSYAAVLSVPLLVPTVELSVRPSEGLAAATSPWVLLSARTTSVSASGWVDEHIDAWGPDGDHLGSARQIRLVRS